MKPRPKNWKPERHACILFNCDRRRGHYCCRECSRRRECSNPCQNTTDRCGYHRPTVEKAAGFLPMCRDYEEREGGGENG